MIFNILDHTYKDLLPVHPQPFPDELLSSWLVRLAHSNHFKVHTFCRLFIGEKREIWNRDIDVNAPAWLIEAICKVTSLKKELVEQTTLKSFEGLLIDRIYPNTVTPWILPLGVFHRNRTLQGLQYCPICLKLDDYPYYRKQWRLSFYTVCEFHNTLMQDQCIYCHSPIVFHRNDIGFKKEYFLNSMVLCHFCGQDLSRIPIQKVQYPSLQISQVFEAFLPIYRLGWTDYPLPQIMYAPLFLNGLRIIISLLTSIKEKAKLPLLKIEEDMGIRNKKDCLPMSITFERRCIDERHRLLNVALWLLMDWPFRFQKYYKNSKITKSIILKDTQNPPFFLLKTLNSI